MMALMLARLIYGLLLVPADGLQTASQEGSSAQIEGLTPETWPHLFDPTLPPPRMQLPARARGVQSVQGALSFVQEAARAIGRQMGAPQMPHDFQQGLGDGTMASFQAKTREQFHDVQRYVSGIDGVVDFGLGNIGAASSVNPEEAYNAFSMTAQRLGASTLANQFAPLLRSNTPPNPTVMFNMIGNAMASLNMPKETVDFYRSMARIRMDGTMGNMQQLHYLQNSTVRLLRNRTMMQVPQMRQDSNPDVYKATQNLMIIIYELPCAPGSTVCFSLSNEFIMFKKGPGWWHTPYFGGGEKGMAVALGVQTRTPWSMISTPFYIYPGPTVGHEYDIKFKQGLYQVKTNSKSKIKFVASMKDTPTCVGTGAAAPDRPRVDTCPYVCLLATGGTPNVYVVGEVMPTQRIGRDVLTSFYNFFQYGGEIGKQYEMTTMPDWAFVGFYRSVQQ